MITGASGWLGSETADLIAEVLGDEFRSRVTLVSSSSKTMRVLGNSFQTIGWEDFKTLKSIDLLIHFSYLNQDKAELMGLPQFVQINRSITTDVNYVLNLNPGCDVLAASSGAASYYRADINSTNSMEVYASLKVESEDLYIQNSNIGSIVNMRIWNVTGPGLDLDSRYALADFFKQALKFNKIEIKGNSKSSRTYIDVKEMMSIFLLSLEKKQRITIDSGGYRISLLNLATKVLDEMNLPITSTILSGESKSISHYNPNPELFRNLASEFQFGLSDVDTQVANLSKIFASFY